MTIADVEAIAADIRCSVGGTPWSIHVDLMGSTGFYIQLNYIEADVFTGSPAEQHGRKWYISAHSTTSEVAQTILKACLTSAEHMVRENFRYKDARVFAPHFDVEKLVELASAGECEEARGAA